MPNFLAMSFEGELAPSFDLRCLQAGRKLPDGWGIGFYPGGEPSASVLKEPAPSQGSIHGELVRAWEHLAASVFVLHIRTATWGAISDANTQPFLKSWGRRDWLLAHSGSLNRRLGVSSHFEPVGSTDTEEIFCELLSRIADQGWKTLGDADPAVLHRWFQEVNSMGSLTTVLTDGRDLAVYADKNREGTVYWWQLMPPHGTVTFADEDLEVDLTRRGIKARKGVIFSTEPMAPTADCKPDWQLLEPGRLVVVREGALRALCRPEEPAPSVARPSYPQLPKRAEVKRLAVEHKTVYRYEIPVERSTHLVRLSPAHDRLQTLLTHEVKLSVEGQHRDYDDVFGNRVRRIVLDQPFRELVIEARSLVELSDTDPLSFRPLRFRSTIPLVWMPFQRHMLGPYLLPQEAPESELNELIEYAMSFVERNDYDLLNTLLDINTTIWKEYEYRQGATTVLTTPFEVYANRQGVCQDFTNLFICLARLLGVPARYACGYLYIGDQNDNGAQNRYQAQASHAWVQVYLPEVGWKGFDPTNGILTQTDHVRVAVGRSYVEATPTSGTIFVGGGGETLEVSVSVTRVG